MASELFWNVLICYTPKNNIIVRNLNCLLNRKKGRRWGEGGKVKEQRRKLGWREREGSEKTDKGG